MSSRRSLLVVGALAALSAAILLASPALVWLRVLVGLPFLLLLPGHAVMLVADRDQRLGGLEWFALSVGSSVAVVMMVGMVLASSRGMTANAMVVALTLLILLCLAVAWTRSRGALARPPVTPGQPGVAYRLAFGALALLACALLVLALSSQRPPEASRVVQLWGLPDKFGGLRIGARNVNADSRQYHLTIEQAGRLIARQELDMPIGADRLFDVRKSATWTNTAPVVAALSDDRGVVATRTISVWTTE